jgi:uncharacterized protein YndB with AHSA1/START domain
MSDFTRSWEVVIKAPVHEVFEYCRDPRHLFGGWPELTVTDVVMTEDGVGTRAHIVGRFAKGMVVEEIEREFTDVVYEERIVSAAHATVRFAGRTTEVAHGPIFSWLFEPADGGTKLIFVDLEENVGWWQNLFESISAVVMTKTVRSMLESIRTAVESEAAAAA